MLKFLFRNVISELQTELATDTWIALLLKTKVLSGLAISLLNDALWQTRQINQSQVGAWLLTKFQ
ncbi:hypothetical protein A4S05_36390 [Nostoc sp. KVJ20]|nr:hypothetical protein A4S05_36390 [Nostoc sp. KVJ20]